jgi:ribosome-associated protein
MAWPIRSDRDSGFSSAALGFAGSFFSTEGVGDDGSFSMVQDESFTQTRNGFPFLTRGLLFRFCNGRPSFYARPIPKNSSNPKTVLVREEPIELCQLLKFSGLADTGGEAKYIISEGLVLLNGEVETRKRKKVMAGDQVTYAEQTIVVRIG